MSLLGKLALFIRRGLGTEDEGIRDWHIWRCPVCLVGVVMLVLFLGGMTAAIIVHVIGKN